MIVGRICVRFKEQIKLPKRRKLNKHGEKIKLIEGRTY